MATTNKLEFEYISSELGQKNTTTSGISNQTKTSSTSIKNSFVAFVEEHATAIQTGDIALTTITKFLDVIKPNFLYNAFQQLRTTDSWPNRLSVVLTCFEVYGLLWSDKNIPYELAAGVIADYFEQDMERATPESFDFVSRFDEFCDKIGVDRSVFARAGKVAQLVIPVIWTVFSVFGASASPTFFHAMENIAKVFRANQVVRSEMDYFKTALSIVSDTFAGTDLEPAERLMTELRNFHEECMALKIRIKATRAYKPDDRNVYRDFGKRYDAYNALIREMSTRDIHLPPVSMSLVIDIRKAMEDIADWLSVLERSNTVRQAPVCIWVQGDPGHGKSSFAPYLVKLLGQHEGKKLSIYGRNSSKFFQDYANQDVVLWDEFCSHPPELLGSNEVKEFQDLCSNNPIGVDGAGVADKNVCFNSRYIIICSNHMTDPFSTTVCPGAIDRRRDLLIKMVDPELVRQMDEHKMLKSFRHKKPDFSESLFIRFNPFIEDGVYRPWSESTTPLMTPNTIAAEAYRIQLERAEHCATRLAYADEDPSENYTDLSVPSIDDIDFDAFITKPAYLNSRFSVKSTDRVVQPRNPTATSDTMRAGETIISAVANLNPAWRPQRNRGFLDSFANVVNPNRDRSTFRPNSADFFEQQSDDADDDVCDVLEEFECQSDISYRSECFLLLGKPGLGKSTVADACLQTHNVFDDPDPELFKEIVTEMWFHTEGKGQKAHRPVLVVLNPEKWNPTLWNVETTGQSFAAIKSRFTIVLFRPSVSGVFKSMSASLTRSSKELDFNKDVWITIDKRNYNQTQIIQFVTNYAREPAFVPSLTIDTYSGPRITKSLKLNHTAVEYLKRITLADAFMMCRQMRIDLEQIKLMRQILNAIPKACEEVETVALSINNAKIRVSRGYEDVCIIFSDIAYALTSLDGFIIVKLIPLNQIDEFIEEPRVLSIIGSFFSFLLRGLTILAKLAISFFVNKSSDIRLAATKRIRTKIPAPHYTEGWAEDVELADASEFCQNAPVNDWTALPPLDPTTAKRRMSAMNPWSNGDSDLKASKTKARKLNVIEAAVDKIARMGEYNKDPPKVVDKKIQPPIAPLTTEGSEMDKLFACVKKTTPTPANAHFVETASSVASDSERHLTKQTHQTRLMQIPTTLVEVHPPPKVTLPTLDILQTESGSYTASDDFVRPEMSCDPSAMDTIQLVTRSMIYIGSPTKPILRGIMLYGHVGVTAAHYFAKMYPGEDFEVYTAHGVKLIAKFWKVDAKRDIGVFKLHVQSPQFPDIRAHIPTREDSIEHRGQRAGLIRMYPTTGKHSMFISTVLLQDITSRMYETGQQVTGLTYNGFTRGLSYLDPGTNKGDCGSPIIAFNSKYKAKLLGFHIASSSTQGLAAVLFREDCTFHEPMIAQCDQKPITVLPHQCVTLFDEPYLYKSVRVVGYLSKPDGSVNHQFHSDKTRLYRSPLAITCERLPDMFEPCILSQDDRRLPPESTFHPYRDGCDKFVHDFVPLSDVLVDHCITEISNFYADLAQTHNHLCRKMTKTEALNGTSLFNTSNQLSRDSSAGYPWKDIPSLEKKKQFFVFDDDNQIWRFADTMHGRELNRAIDADVIALMQGKRIATVSIATLKDEPRKIRRIYDVPDSRIFYSCPVDFCLVNRIYKHMAACSISDLHEKHPIKIGMNACGRGMNNLFNFLTRVGNFAFDLDATAWDSTLPPQIIGKLYRIYNAIYERCDPLAENNPGLFAREQFIREQLTVQMTHPLVAYYDFVVEFNGGNISGQTTTSLDNSLVNFVLSFYAYLSLCEKHHLSTFVSFASFRLNTEFAFYGDDSITVFSHEFASLVSPSEWIEEFAKCGIKLTSIDKLPDTQVNYKPVQSCIFLQRSFKPAQFPNGTFGQFTGALQLETFRKMLDWTTGVRPHHVFIDKETVFEDPLQIQSTINSCLIEACNLGIEPFNIFRRHLMGKLNVDGEAYTYLSYADAFSIIWSLPLSNDSAYDQLKIFSYDPNQFEPQSNDMSDKNGGPQPAVVGEKGAPSEISFSEAIAKPANLSKAQAASASTTSAIVPYSGAIGPLDGNIYRPILLETVSWSSTQQAGTILYSNTISPSTQNPVIQYFTMPYNCWSGGFIYEITPVGTGYNGGKVRVCHVPPNVDPTGLTAEQLTVYPGVEIDVKQSESFAIHCNDEKQVIYHYNNTDDPTSTDANGGTFIMYVLSPLVNANGSACSVNILVFNRAAESFRATQLNPIEYAAENSATLLSAAGLLPDHYMTEPNMDVPAQFMYISAPAATASTGLYGQTDAAGTNAGNYKYAPLPDVFYGNDDGSITDIQGVSVTRPIILTNQSGNGGCYYATEGTITGSLPGQLLYTGAGPGVAVPGETQFNMTDATLWTGIEAGGLTAIVSLFGNLYRINPVACPNPITFVQNESLVTFVGYAQTIGTVQPMSVQTYITSNCLTAEQILFLESGKLSKVIGPGQAILFTVFSRATRTPVGLMKFNYPGYFTTIPTATSYYLDYADYYFVPTQVMAMTSPIPMTSTLSMNHYVDRLSKLL